MVSKRELQEQIEQMERRNTALKRANEALKRANDAHSLREHSRIQREIAEDQRKRREAEREDKRKRLQELNDGLLRLEDASDWRISRDADGAELRLTVPLSEDVVPIVHGVLTKGSRSTMTLIPSHALPDPFAPTLDQIRRAMGFAAGGAGI